MRRLGRAGGSWELLELVGVPVAGEQDSGSCDELFEKT